MTVDRMTAAGVFLLLASAVTAQPPKEQPKTEVTADEKKAREAFAAGKLDDALKLLQAAGQSNPLIGLPKAVAARWCVETGQGQQARLLLEQAAKEEPGHPDVFLTNGMFALNEGRITDTILSCTAALQAAESPRWDADAKKRYRREARTGLVAAFENRADHASVKIHLAALLEADPKNVGHRQRLARTNFLLDRPDDAFADLQAAVKDDPTLDPPELTMAQLWTAKTDFPKAEDWFAKAVAAHPKSAIVHRGFAGYLLDRGRPDAGKAHLGAAQKIEPTSRDTKALTGLFARQAKDYPAAAAVFEELVREHPTYGFATANLALVLAESADANGKRRSAELAEAFAKQNGKSADARAVFAYCALKAGRAADAEKLARSALGMGSIAPDGAYFLAVVLADNGDIEAAHKLAKAAGDSKDGFVYRKECETLTAALEKKLPPPKKP